MASCCCSHLLSAAVLLAALVAAVGTAPSYYMPGQSIPRRPLPSCRWYVASRTCGGAPRLPLPVMKERSCRELEAVPAACRCKALRVMVDDMSVYPAGGGEQQTQTQMLGQERCWHAQAEFAATVVTEPECGLPTIHGSPFCYALGAEY